MSRRLVAVVVVVLIWSGVTAGYALLADGGAIRQFGPGAPGIGDPYFPRDGNDGYDVKHYDLDVRYEPSTDELSGVETIRARATQNLSSFNLDLVGLNVRYIAVNGRRAGWSREGDQLTITPRRKLSRGQRFNVFVVYDGVPDPSATARSASRALSTPTTARS